MTHPDQDLTAKKLELALQESNLSEHEEQAAEAALLVKGALDDLTGLPRPADTIGVLLLAHATAATAGAMAQIAQTRLMLEHERSNIQHARAHVDHQEAEMAKQGEVKDRVAGAMEALRQQLEAEGIQIVPGMFGGGTIGLHLGDLEGE